MGERADVIYTNGRIYTVDADRPWAEAVATRGRDIVYVGDASGIGDVRGPDTRVVDLGGRLMLPGLVESHIHLLLGSASVSGVILSMDDDVDDILAAVRDHAASHPDEPVVFGAAFNSLLFGAEGPDRALLDGVVADRPVILLDHTMHSAWANTLAFERAGVSASTPDPLPGEYAREADGTPHGFIKGSPASLPVLNALQAITPESMMRSIPTVLRGLSAFGFTALLECGNPILTEAGFAALAALDRQGELPLRASLTAFTNSESTAQTVLERTAQYAADYSTEHLWFDTVKILGDSVLENYTAALLEPYLTTGTRGHLYFADDVLQDLVTRVGASGYGVIMHAIGDRAVRQGLDAAEHLRASGDDSTRFILTHAQLINPDDVPRFAPLGVQVQTTGNWAVIQPRYDEMIGAERMERDQFPFHSLVESGVSLCLGADWPATFGGFDAGVNPFVNIYTALHRRAPRHLIGEFATVDRVLPPANETLTLDEAIAGCTLHGARALGREHEFGSISVGKRADLVVLDRDLFAVDPEEIPFAKVVLTVMDGRAVYEADGDANSLTSV